MQNLAEKLRRYQIDNDAKFAEQKSVIDTLNIVWRSIVIAVVVFAIAAIFSLVVTFGLPSVYKLGENFRDRWSVSSEDHRAAAPPPPPPNSSPPPKQQ